MPVEIVTNFDEVAGRLIGMSEGVAAAIDPAVAAAAEGIRQTGVIVLMAHTPVSADDAGGEHLRDTTEGEVAPAILSSMIAFRQTKTIPIHGDDVPLAELLRTGRRGDYDIYPVNAKALFWPGAAHPVKHVHITNAVAPNPYVAEAMAEVDAGVQPLLAAAGAGILSSAIAVRG